MADIYGANLYNRYLQTAQYSQAQKQANQSGVCAQGVDQAPKMTLSEQGVAPAVSGSGSDLPEACHSILVCTGVYSKEEELPSDTGHTVTEQRIFHGHRDFRFDPSLTQPSFVVQDVKDAVELVFRQEGWPLN